MKEMGFQVGVDFAGVVVVVHSFGWILPDRAEIHKSEGPHCQGGRGEDNVADRSAGETKMENRFQIHSMFHRRFCAFIAISTRADLGAGITSDSAIFV
jgi:hypothetical protein